MVALKLKVGKEPTSSDSYQNSELVTYAEARKSTNPEPYIAAVVTSKNENMFVLGDGRNTSDPTSRRRRSTSSDYYNGPLEPGTSYSIFQRIVLNDKVWYLLVITLLEVNISLSDFASKRNLAKHGKNNVIKSFVYL